MSTPHECLSLPHFTVDSADNDEDNGADAMKSEHFNNPIIKENNMDELKNNENSRFGDGKSSPDEKSTDIVLVDEATGTEPPDDDKGTEPTDEGYYLRDMVLILDDYKAPIISKKKVIRISQNYADNTGRARLNSSSELQKTPHIRGSLISTGENFLEDEESVLGRTIVIEVEPEHNQVAGEACKTMQHNYNGFIPAFVHWCISVPDWQENLKLRINQRIADFSSSVDGISNGLRIATNWALNAVGFELYGQFALHIGAIDATCYEQLIAEYEDIVRDHLKSHEAALKAQSPSARFFSTLEFLIASEAVIILELYRDVSFYQQSDIDH